MTNIPNSALGCLERIIFRNEFLCNKPPPINVVLFTALEEMTLPDVAAPAPYLSQHLDNQHRLLLLVSISLFIILVFFSLLCWSYCYLILQCMWKRMTGLVYEVLVVGCYTMCIDVDVDAYCGLLVVLVEFRAASIVVALELY